MKPFIIGLSIIAAFVLSGCASGSGMWKGEWKSRDDMLWPELVLTPER
jgi:hypothetical protein